MSEGHQAIDTMSADHSVNEPLCNSNPYLHKYLPIQR
jgi:hypothetical protein